MGTISRALAASGIAAAILIAPTSVLAEDASHGEARSRSAVEAPAPARSITWKGAGGGPVSSSTTSAAPIETPASAATAGDRSGFSYAQASTATPTDFLLEFDASVTEQQRTVFRAAANIWGEVLDIRVPIHVYVAFAELPPGALGGAAPTSAWFNDPSFPLPNVAYVAATANQHAGEDLDPSEPEIDVVVSDSEAFYEGTDDNVPNNQYSLLMLAVHELGHGLGHTTWAEEVSPNNFEVRVQGLPLAYDRHVVDAGGRRIIDMSNSQLRTALRSDALYWNGTEGLRRNGNAPIRMYAPGTWESGSSVGHTRGEFDLMFPFIFEGEVLLDIPALTVGMLADTGLPIVPVGREGYAAAITRDFLDRYASQPEMRAVATLLQQGRDRGDIVRAYAYSDEWIGALIDGYYESTLGRLPDASGRAYWISVVKNGTTPVSVAAYFFASEEYFKRSGNTSRAWVSDLYLEILGRTADAGGRDYWARLVDQGMPRDVVAGNFYQSIESRRARVTALYRDLLARRPDSGGLAYWADILQNGRDVELAIFLAASEEYYKRSLRRFS